MATIYDVINIYGKSTAFNQFILKSVKQIKTLEGNPVKNVYNISSIIDAINKKVAVSGSSADKSIIEEWLAEYLPKLELNKKEIHDSFGKSLETLLEASGMELKGQLPELKAGIFTIEVDFINRQTQLWYGPKQELLTKTKLDPEDISTKIAGLYSEFKSPLDETAFLKQTYDAYVNTVRKQNKPEGEHASIIQVLNELALIKQDNRFHTNPAKEYYKEYTRARFSYDLFRLTRKDLGTKVLTLDKAVFMATASRSGFIWIPSDDKGVGSPYAYLYFKERQDGRTSS